MRQQPATYPVPRLRAPWRALPCACLTALLMLAATGCGTLDSMAARRLVREGARAQRAERPAEAERLYVQAIRRHPDYAAAWTELALVCLGQRRSRVAVDVLQEALRQWPDNLRARHYLGIALLQSGNTEGAAAQFAEVIRRDSEYAASWYGLALVAERRGETGLAVEYLLQALKRDPRSATILNRLKAQMVTG